MKLQQTQAVLVQTNTHMQQQQQQPKLSYSA